MRVGTRTIVTVGWPGEAVLRRKAKAVGRLGTEDYDLIEDMIATLQEVGGLGLAAPQVGVSKRILVVELEGQTHVLVDPVLRMASGTEVAVESCLSIPDVAVPVARAYCLTAEGKNRRGKGVRIRAQGLLARVLQHEVDHLDGILITDPERDLTNAKSVV